MEQQWVYESPDGGKTVYRRPFGSDYTEKELHYQDQEYLRELILGVQLEDWKPILAAAGQDATLADLLDRAKCYYQLKHA